MSARRPAATAFLTVFNERDAAPAAVRSLLEQTLSDVEVLVVDDGSDDGTAEALEALGDDRVRVIRGGRLGRAGALNLACREARGEILANLDADDRAFPDRLAEQVAFFKSHPDHVWCGTAVDRDDRQRGEHAVRRYPEVDAAVRRLSAKCIPYCHSAVAFRRALIDAGVNYDPAVPYLIDFEFFLRAAGRGKVANLPAVLTTRTLRNESYFQSRFARGEQNRALAKLCASAVRRFDLPRRNYVYPALRLGYPLLPNALKRRVRRRGGIGETNVGETNVGETAAAGGPAVGAAGSAAGAAS